jgi:hypothetical protein
MSLGPRAIRQAVRIAPRLAVKPLIAARSYSLLARTAASAARSTFAQAQVYHLAASVLGDLRL